jgi:hypothetical protein
MSGIMRTTQRAEGAEILKYGGRLQRVARAEPEADQSFPSVSLLLHMNGANDGTTFTDTSANAHTITVSGGAKLTTTGPKLGSACGTFDGASDYLTTPASSTFAFGTGNFTVEFWCYPNVVSDNDGLFTFGSSLFLALYAGNWMLGTAGSGGSSMGAASTGSWQHVAVTRSGTSLRLFVDGAQVGSTLTDSTNLAQNQMAVGYYYDSTFGFNGKIDELRVTKGVARYTADFTPRTTEFPDR